MAAVPMEHGLYVAGLLFVLGLIGVLVLVADVGVERGRPAIVGADLEAVGDRVRLVDDPSGFQVEDALVGGRAVGPHQRLPSMRGG